MANRIERMAIAAVQGMLAHPTRYQPREEDAHLHWHDAITKEAVEIAEAMDETLTQRGYYE